MPSQQRASSTRDDASAIRGRFAPTPSGRLHWGNLRTALLTWLQIRLRGGTLVLRIEDIDSERSREHLVEAIYRDLDWLGLFWDEGPDRGGSYGPYRQSQCIDRYRDAMRKLEVYGCRCTRARLQQQRQDSGSEAYPGTCRALNLQGETLAWRWKVPAGRICFDDRGYGTICQDVQREVGDFVLRRKNGDFAYQLAVVVDDAFMQISEVCRGADLLDNTPRQLLLCDALGYPRPRHLHLPLVLGPDGRKLSKREGAPDLDALRSAGRSREEVIALLAQSAGLISSHLAAISLSELLSRVQMENIEGLARCASTRGS